MRNPRSERLAALDAFRGLTIAGMLLVNNPGTWSAIYPPLRHAEWHGWTPTDLIFPFFLFIVGITTHLCRAVRGIALIVAVLLLGYWALVALVPPPGAAAVTLDEPSRTLAAYIDRLLLDGHLWSASRTWDPEGPLATLPAIGTCLLGVLAGRWLTRATPLSERLSGLFAAGTLAMAAGAAWGWVFPINKNLWTSSYVLVAGGFSLLLLAAFYWIIDVRGFNRWAFFFTVIGMNAIVAYIAPDIIPFKAISHTLFAGLATHLGMFGNFLLAAGAAPG